MAPTKFPPNTWKRLAVNAGSTNHVKSIPRHQRKSLVTLKSNQWSTSSSDKAQMSSPKLKINSSGLLNFVLSNNWTKLSDFTKGKNRGEVLTTVSVISVNPKRNCAGGTGDGSKNSKDHTLLDPTLTSHAGASISAENATALWIKRLSRQLTDVTVGIVSQWKIAAQNHSSLSSTVTTTEEPVKIDTEKIPNATQKVLPPQEKVLPPQMKLSVSRAALESRAQYLLQSMAVADTSNMSRHIQVKELCKFLIDYPHIQGFLTKAGANRQLLLMKNSTRDPVVLEDIQEGLSLLGHCRPPSGWGIRILSIDGGGLRGMMALEVLRQLEELTGKPIHQLFDYICGVSTGSVLAILLGSLKCSVSKCEQLYKQIGTEIFQQNPIWGTGKLVLSHAFYDTNHWVKMLNDHIGKMKLIETSRDPACPKIAAVSTVVSTSRLEPFLFRNYDYPPRVMSRYRGTHQAELWEAARASAAAPLYFEEFKFGNDIHQDGGVLVNNPTALAIHECKQLWPYETLQCVISLGNGRFEPLQTPATTAPNYTGLKGKLMKIIDSATDTEAVHTVLHDLLPPTVYFRFNPYLTEDISLDETRPEKILQLQKDARMYIRRNESMLNLAASTLTQSRNRMQKLKDFVAIKKLTYLN